MKKVKKEIVKTMKIIFLLFSISVTTVIYSQAPEVKANEIYNFSKIDFSQVDEYTGKASITLPITSIKLDNIEIPISIDYLMGGIKVNELASPVGLGWYLNAGGKVYKTIKGIEDNKMVYYVGIDGIGSVKKGYLLEPTNYEEDIPDEYSTNLPYLKTKFIIKKDFSIAEVENFNEHKITINRDYTDPNISKKYGTITDYFGSRYVCGERYLYNYLLSYNSLHAMHPQYDANDCPWTHSEYIDTQGLEINNNGYLYKFNDWDHTFAITGGDSTQGTLYTKSDDFHSSYNLTSLTSLKSNKAINFTYTPIVMLDNNLIPQKAWNVFTPEDNSGDTYIYPYMDDNNISLPNLYFIQRLKKISSDELTIEFNYENSRIDLKGKNLAYADTNYLQTINEQLLKSIYIKDINNNIIWTYLFTYSYFNSDCDANNSKCNRLKLEKIEKFGGNINSSIKEEHSFTYYEDTKLPPIGFGKKDAFGYSNGLGNLTTLSVEIKKPKIYFYNENIGTTNEKNYYSPFYVPALNPVVINGEDMSSTLSDTRAWSLKSVTYPTKGKQEFEYELNSFKWKNYTFNGGGLRIKKINLTDNNIVQSIFYNYLDDNNETTGSIVSVPKFNGEQFCYNSGSNPFYTTIYSDPQLELTKGSNVGYKKVTISKTNNGKITKEYENPETKPNSLIKFFPDTYNASNYIFLEKENFYGQIHTEDNDFSRGSVILEKVFNNTNQLLKETQSIYQISKKDSITTKIYYGGYNGTNNNFFRYFNNEIICDYSSSNGLGSSPSNFIGSISEFRQFSFRRNNLIQKKVKDYYPNGFLENITSYTYNNDYNTLSKVRFHDSDNKTTDKIFYYPQNFTYLPELINQFRITDQVKTEVVYNGTQTYETYTKFDKNTETSSLMLPTENHAIKGPGDIDHFSSSDRKIVYNKYDNKGNLLQYTPESGTPMTIIWGYNKTQPIAKIENATYSQITAYVDNLQTLSNTDSETSLLNALDNLRNALELTSALVTTYTYKPLIGVSTITDPKGYTIFYEYDTFNRLKLVKDALGNILSENQYHYKN
ncbi:hypothetical protein EKL97_15235 [Flavobacterium sp. LS1P28]|uniref:hypothetical protein n=1 Tax=Flavobacterium sp. LS1P28 TaxID=2497752 RepID=UPI000F82AC81|nr:hypothetical protein [Flavobacterium sp. LS1P28]RTY77496.1 hypothetical protein EKL97_15235 [Flavobacterium sp. LS1P28]